MSAASGPWSDERLTAAFATRASEVGQAPTGLAEAVVSRIAVDARRPRPRFTWSGSFAAAMAAVVIVAAVVGLSRSNPPSPASQPPATSAGATNTPANSGAITPAPASAPASSVASPATLDPIDVSEALRIRDAFLDDRELAVKGYLSPEPMLFCPLADGEPNPVAVQCPASYQYLMENAESTVSGRSLGPPGGPAFHLSFALVTSPSRPRDVSGAFAPVSVELIGHFHDRRSKLCRSSSSDTPAALACDNIFLVDRVRQIGGIDQAVTTTTRLDRPAGQKPVRPLFRDADVDRIVGTIDPGAVVLSRYVTLVERVATIEPALRNDRPWELSTPIVWSVTVLDAVRRGPPVPRTFLIADGAGTFLEMTEGPPVLVPLGPSQSPGAS